MRRYLVPQSQSEWNAMSIKAYDQDSLPDCACRFFLFRRIATDASQSLRFFPPA
jgi:hypothetical protein